MDCAVRAALKGIAEIRVAVNLQDLTDNLFSVFASKHITRKFDTVVEVARKTMQVLPLHCVGDLDPFQRPIDEAFLPAAFRHRINRWVAITTEAGIYIPNRGLGHVVRIEAPVPVAELIALAV
jgi:hypothetical protein